MAITRRALAVLLAIWVVASPAGRAEGGEGERIRDLEERIRHLEAENRRLRQQVEVPAQESAATVTDDLRPGDGWQFRADPSEHRHPDEAFSAPDPTRASETQTPLRDRLYVKEIVSDAGC